MPTECNRALFEFPRVESRAVVASFDGGQITSEAGALLLGATDKVIGLTRRLAACFGMIAIRPLSSTRSRPC